MSGADFLSPAAENKTEHLGINLLEQGTQGSSSEGREIPPVKSSGSERRCSHCRPGPGPSLPSALFAHSTSRLPGASCSQCAQAGCRQLLLHGTHSLRAFLELAGSLTYGDDVLGFFFLQKPENFSTFVMLQSGRGQGHWGNLLFILEVCIRFPTAERHAV